MTAEQYCFCDLAPLYVLDLLSDSERQWVEQQLEECPDLIEELASYQEAIDVLPYAAPPVPMADDLKGRLFDRLGLDLPVQAPPHPSGQVDAPDILSVRSRDVQWQPHPVPGVRMAIFHRDPDKREITGVLRAEPGVHYLNHQHADIEEIYMLEGDLVMGETTYHAGDYLRSYPGSMHEPYTTEGCMFFFRTSMDDQYPLTWRNITRLMPRWLRPKSPS
jgi:ChrR Cupin-like domain